MKRGVTKNIALFLALFLSLCFLFSCTDNENKNNDNIDNSVLNPTVKIYKVRVEKGLGFGEIKADAKKTEEDGTLYEISVIPRAGYAVKSFKIDGNEFALAENKTECVLNSDVSISVEYCRKTNEELERRRDTVLEKMKLITGTQFCYDRDYEYLISGRDTVIEKDTLYQGMPYANNPTLSFEAFLDFCTGPDENGVYAVGDILASPKYVWGNNCADVVYWAWSTISTTIDCTVSAMFTEKYGCEIVGDVEISLSDYGTSYYKDTTDICEKNGADAMFEAYAMLLKGDGCMFYRSEGGHVIMVGDVSVRRGNDGKISGDRSFIRYYDQNTGYSEKNGKNGGKVMSSCAYDLKMTFSQLYNDGYLPVTCKELLDDSYEIAKETVTDSISETALNKTNVVRGYIQSNYYISKLRMEITDNAGNTVYAANRYRDESNPHRALLSWFASKSTVSYEEKGIDEIYKDLLDLDSFESGTYNCKVIVYLSTGNSHVVRDFQFTK